VANVVAAVVIIAVCMVAGLPVAAVSATSASLEDFFCATWVGVVAASSLSEASDRLLTCALGDGFDVLWLAGSSFVAPWVS